MRLHHLTATAFGPFGGTVEVDFDRLSDAGLFLLTGATGAGKTSVLDAVCFALYGVVPGDRDSAKHLRSDHAGPTTSPRVMLLLDIGGRTFRFTRSPAWQRPKKRGTGTTPQHASVVVEERVGADWATLSTRLDEAGDLVTDLLGMTATQFTQVAMLPQGRFQAFLRASSADRHKVLQRLFRTERFERVERWLVEHRLELRRRSGTLHATTSGVLSRFQEAAALPHPASWDPLDLSPVARSGELLGWSVGVRDGQEAEHARATARLQEADALLLRVRTEHQVAVRRAELQARGRRAAGRLAELDAEAGTTSALKAALDAHQRAATVRPLAERARRDATAAADGAREVEQRVADVAALLVTDPGSVDVAIIDEHRRAVAGKQALAEAFVPREVELAAADRTRKELEAAVAGHERGITTLDEELAALPAALATHRDRVEVLSAEAAREADLAQARAAAEQAHRAAVRAAALETDLTALRADLTAATGLAQDLREIWLQIREDRINGMAAELAGQLAVGCACPVCGSAEHPTPARTAVVVGREREQQAQRDHEEAQFAQQALAEAVATAEAGLAAARAGCDGRTVEDCAAALATATHAAGAASAAAAGMALARAELDALVARESRARAERERDLAALIDTRARRDAAATTVSSLNAELRDLLEGACEATTVTELVAEHRATRALLDQARGALDRHATADEVARAAAEAADQAAVLAGFSDVATALAAVLPDDEAARTLVLVEEETTARASCSATLADAEVVTALAADAVDLTVSEQVLTRAGQARDGAARDAETACRRAVRLRELHAELASATAAWLPVVAELETAAAMAAFAEGKSVDNPLRMRLSAYVLTERLRQVIAAANERLARMSDQRYSLEHRDERGAGEQRGGLSLVVRDDWNGITRDPATLSGGETFVVSLALALGLADTVALEAGGCDIDTLFIDEGFGSLDADTLEQVMDALDDLRSSGRVVGVVSHVAEMRDRIPTRLEVTKGRSGSSVLVSPATA